MVFSSYIFLYLFLPICLLCYGLSRSITLKNAVLIVFSLVFYAWGEPTYILLLLLSVAVNYLLGIAMERCGEKNRPRGKKAFFVSALIFNIGLLLVFKYSGFIVENLNRIPHVAIPVPRLELPIGISFYTFQALAYIIDLYWGNVRAQRNPMKFLLYISMFPQLVAGPIVRYSAIEREISARKTTLADFSAGLTRLVLGLSKKVILANHLSTIVKTLFEGNLEQLSVAGTWLGALIYAMQMYFDFSGYSDMAIGMGLMFGFHFNENFDHPFICRDISEFWQRWHISLGSFFRDYLLYVPIFGKRRKYGGLLLVWFCTGLWHGASWNFVLWGLYFGLFIALEQLIGRKRMRKIPLVLRHIYSKIVIIIGFGIFYFTDFSKLKLFFRNLLGLGGNALIDSVTQMSVLNNLFLILLAIVCCFPVYQAFQNRARRSPGSAAAVSTVSVALNAVLLALCTVLLVDQTNNPFLYFNF